MEDYRKQLPLRQRKDKPTLKYSTGQYPASALYPSYGRQPAAALGADNYYTDSYFASRTRNLYYGTTTSSHNNGLTPAQILAASIQTSTKVTSNPYSRPISAQDVKKPVVAAATVVVPKATASSTSIGSNSRVSPSTLQTNSFMRPQSAVVVNNDAGSNHSSPVSANDTEVIPSKSDTTVEVNNMSNGVPESRTSKPRVPPVVSPEFLMTQPVARPPSGLRPGSARPGSGHYARPASTQQHIRPGSGQPPRASEPVKQASQTDVSKVSPQMPRQTSSSKDVRAATSATTPAATSIVNVGLPPKSSHTNINRSTPTPPTNRFTDRFSGRPNSGSRPGSGSHGSSRPGSGVSSSRGVSRPGTPGSDHAVRNLNYTPSKPYSEVSSPNTSASMAVTGNTVNKHELRKANTEPAIKIAEETSKMCPDSTKITNHTATSEHHAVKKMPVTNTMTGTIYYRKASKGEEMIGSAKPRPLPKSELIGSAKPRPLPKSSRPQAEGATAKVKRSEVKVAEEDEDDEWTDEEEDTGSKVNRERSPGDGADSSGRDYDEDDTDDDDDVDAASRRFVTDDMDDDDEALDDLNDDDYGGSDDQSSTFSIHTSRRSSASSRRSSASSRVSSASSALRVRSATRGVRGMTLTPSRPHTARPRSTTPDPGEKQPALMPSLFPNVPPTVNFVLDGEKVDPLPWEFRKLLKWRMSPITPNVVKNCIARSGFRYSKKNHDWLGYWGKHMKAQGFTAIRPYQKVNHFPGSFQIGRKDRLWRNLSKMQAHYGRKDFGFFPQTYVLPVDTKQLKRAFEEGANKQKWIIKPPASARGIGIKVISKWAQVPKKRSVIVQRYLGRPYLINESKFDLRVYVYVTSYDPLRIYVYDDGLARFASCKYSYSMKNINNKYMHLTNYSINKNNDGYEANSDENVCQGHKWGLKALWGYMKKQGINTSAVWDSIKDLVVKTIISSESCVNSMVKVNVKKKSCCHELFGFDVMLDENLKPWIIEVNISPSLHSNSQLDMNIKGGMIRDLMNLAGFQLPDKTDVTATSGGYDCKSAPPNPLVIDKRLYPTAMSSDERAKHAYYCQRSGDEFTQATITDILTAEDVRMLAETIDEDSRRGNFQRVFPHVGSHKYLRYMEQPRYYNLLLDAWTQKYCRMEARGIAAIEALCMKGIHLENPTDDPQHQWVPPSSTLPRDSRGISASETTHLKARPLPTLRSKKLGTASSGTISSATSTASRPPTARSVGAMGAS